MPTSVEMPLMFVPYGRETERYLKAKSSLKHLDQYPPWLQKELKRMVAEYEKKYASTSVKPKYVGVPESSWLNK